MIGAGSVVTKDVPPNALVVGNPAKNIGWVSKSGYKMRILSKNDNVMFLYCDVENKEYQITLR